MVRRILIGGMIAVVVSLVILLVFLFNRDSFDEIRAESAVPGHAVLYIDNIDYTYFSTDFCEHNLLWKEAVSIPRFRKYDSLFQAFTVHIRQAPALKEILSDGKLSLSVHLQGKKTLAAMFYLETGTETQHGEIASAMHEMFGKEAIINSRKYEATVLYDVSLQSDGAIKQLVYTSLDGLVIMSTSSLLVEDAIRTLHSDSGIGNAESFCGVAETAGRYVHGNLYLNYRRIGQLLAPIENSGSLSGHDAMNRMAEWGAFDIDIKDDVLLFSGMTAPVDTSGLWLNMFNRQEPVREEILSAVPSNVTNVFCAGISGSSDLVRDMKTYFRMSGSFQSFEKSDARLKKDLGSSPLSDLEGMMGDELSCFHIETNGSGNTARVSMVEITSRSGTLDVLEGWADSYAASAGASRSSVIDEYMLDPQTSFRIYHFPLDFYSGSFPGMIFMPFVAVYDNYLVFSDSRKAIERTIYQNILHKTLANDPTFEYISDYVSTRSNLTWIIRPGNLLNSLKPRMNSAGIQLVDELEPLIRKIPGAVFQLSREGSMFYANATVTYTGQIKERALTVWESLLDTVALMKPALVVNHNTNEKEILIQDASNTLYLVNSTGRILWKLRLDEQIMSDIFQVDFYRNGKLQYLFNTRTALHLLDRNGNYVERYPVNLRANATNGMVLFDYDKNRDYRIFVACEDRKIYLYDLEGNIIPGWSFRISDGIITRPLQHFRVGDKDYIVCSDPIRTYILNRRGRDRVRIKEMPVVSRRNDFYLDMNTSGDQPRLVTTDTSGNVIGIDFNGNAGILLANEAGPEHFFRLEDMDQDGVAEYIFTRDNELEMIDARGKRIFSFKIKSDISMIPDVYQFSANDLKLGITDKERNKIYLLNSDGSVYEGFPLEGSTRFSIGYFIGSDSQFNLIVGSDKGFLYNYSIE